MVYFHVHYDMDQIDKLKFLNEKSNLLLERQIDSYRQNHAKAATIIGVIAIFIPFFLNGLSDATLVIKIISIAPVAVLCWAMWLLLMMLRSRPLFQGINLDMLDGLVNKEPVEIILYDIGLNRESYRDNLKLTEKPNRDYNRAVLLTIIAILFSSALLLTNNIAFSSTKKEPIEVAITNDSVSCFRTVDTIRTFVMQIDTITIPINPENQ